MKEKALFSWSGGKDSALALYELMKRADYEIAALLTVLTGDYDRTSMHGVRRVLLEQQAQSLGFALEKVLISGNSSNQEYERKMRDVLEKYQAAGICSVVFGDVFSEDLRKYRENNLSKIGMTGVFPIWKPDTAELARTFIDAGFKAVITCVDSNVLDKMFIARAFDEQLLSELPSGVDPCGENGEFHSFVYDGPIFRHSVQYTTGEVVLREKRFYYCDLVPSENTAPVPGLLDNQIR
jgi:uncharacterized protein (TIGR00290 family)